MKTKEESLSTIALTLYPSDRKKGWSEIHKRYIPLSYCAFLSLPDCFLSPTPLPPRGARLNACCFRSPSTIRSPPLPPAPFSAADDNLTHYPSLSLSYAISHCLRPPLPQPPRTAITGHPESSPCHRRRRSLSSTLLSLFARPLLHAIANDTHTAPLSLHIAVILSPPHNPTPRATSLPHFLPIHLISPKFGTCNPKTNIYKENERTDLSQFHTSSPAMVVAPPSARDFSLLSHHRTKWMLNHREASLGFHFQH